MHVNRKQKVEKVIKEGRRRMNEYTNEIKKQVKSMLFVLRKQVVAGVIKSGWWWC